MMVLISSMGMAKGAWKNPVLPRDSTAVYRVSIVHGESTGTGTGAL